MALERLFTLRLSKDDFGEAGIACVGLARRCRACGRRPSQLVQNQLNPLHFAVASTIAAALKNPADVHLDFVERWSLSRIRKKSSLASLRAGSFQAALQSLEEVQLGFLEGWSFSRVWKNSSSASLRAGRFLHHKNPYQLR